VALVTDSGQFSYENTTPLTHRIAATFLDKGVSPAMVAREVYESKSLASVKLLADGLSTLGISDCGRVAWMWITQQMLSRNGANPDETEGFINYARMVRGIEIALLFRELAAGDKVKVGFRSRGLVDVSELASRFGGGGHPRAAGCTVPGPLKRVAESVIREAVRACEENERRT